MSVMQWPSLFSGAPTAEMRDLSLSDIERTIAEMRNLPRVPVVQLIYEPWCGGLHVLHDYPERGDLTVLIDAAAFGEITARSLADYHRPEGLP
jgi:hypothetical protein